MKKKKNNIQISFLGNNAEHVAGSHTLIEINGYKILLECGLIQGESSILANYQANLKAFKFNPKTIDYIFICHAHADHIAMLPRLYALGCTAKIIAPEGNYEIAKIIMKDSSYIISKNANYLRKKQGKDYPDLFTNEDVDRCLSYWSEFPMNYAINLNNKIKFKFIPSGHIINSAQLKLYIIQNNITKKILYTSDLGNNLPQFFTNNLDYVKSANIVIGECTYCKNNENFTEKNRSSDLFKIKTAIENTCINKQGKILIPCFALQRTQTILKILYDLLKNNPESPLVLIDSPMACKITKLYKTLLKNDQKLQYEELLAWNKLRLIENYKDSEVYSRSKQPFIILAASGMLINGRSVNWAENLLPNKNNTIIFVGYSSKNTLGDKIKNPKITNIKINKNNVIKRCQILDLKSFSSHMQRKKLIEYYSSINCEKICLVHGELKHKKTFEIDLQNEIYKNNKTSKVIAVDKKTKIII